LLNDIIGVATVDHNRTRQHGRELTGCRAGKHILYTRLPVAGKRTVADGGVFVSSAVADIATLEGNILVALSKHGLEIVVAQGCACFWDVNIVLQCLIVLLRTKGGPDKIVFKLTFTLPPIRLHEVREANSTVDSRLSDRTICV